MDLISVVQELLKGQEEQGELNALQRLARAAADPLMRLGGLSAHLLPLASRHHTFPFELCGSNFLANAISDTAGSFWCVGKHAAAHAIKQSLMTFQTK